MKFKLGQEISVEHRLIRKTVLSSDKPRRKIWVAQKTDQKRVIVIGERTLQNGKTYWGEYGYEFFPTDYLRALLVCESLFYKPFYVIDPRNQQTEGE